jgi:membrane-associated protease RseP (regulator of RpoE activity)
VADGIALFAARRREEAMIRIKILQCFALLGSLIASPLATGQDSPKVEPPPPERVAKAEADSEKLILELNNLIVDQAGSGALFGLPSTPDDPKSSVARLADPNKSYSVQTPVYQHPRTLNKTFDALETNFGLSLADADDALRSQLEIAPGQGVVVVSVKPGSLAEHAGLKINDVLLSLGEQKATDVAQVRKVLLGLGKEALEVKLIREGKPSRMSLVGPEHGFPPEAAEFWIGVPVSPVDATLRAHLSSLAEDTGLIVNDVVKGSPADSAKVQKNDILVSLDGKPLKTPDTLIEQIQASKGKPVPLELVRAGKPITLTITPAKRAHPTVINITRSPELQFKYQLVQPNIAIEVDPRKIGTAVPPQSIPEGKIDVRQLIPGPLYQLVPNPQTFQAPTFSSGSSPQVTLHRANPDASTARIEAQLKEVMAKLDEITKALETLKKSVGK